MNRSKIQEYIDKREEQRESIYHADVQDKIHFTLNGHRYALVANYRDAFDADTFADRFSIVLAKYDYIVGDWGYEQLRLRGFYAAQRPHVDGERKIDNLEDYLFEACNFGCPYFVVHNLAVKEPRQHHYRHSRRKAKHKRSNAAIKTRVDRLTQPPVAKRHHQEVKTVRHGRHRRFLMRQRQSKGVEK